MSSSRSRYYSNEIGAKKERLKISTQRVSCMRERMAPGATVERIARRSKRDVGNRVKRKKKKQQQTPKANSRAEEQTMDISQKTFTL